MTPAIAAALGIIAARVIVEALKATAIILAILFVVS